MMSADEQRSYLETVEEYRRLLVVTPRPPSAPARKMIDDQAAKVDRLTALYLARITPASSGSSGTSGSSPELSGPI